MAIRNIDTIVDQSSFNSLKTSDYVQKYYNEALANLGQRNTEEHIIGYGKFSIRSIYNLLEEECPTTIYFSGFHEIDGQPNMIKVHIDNNVGISETLWDILKDNTNNSVLAFKQQQILIQLIKTILIKDCDSKTNIKINIPIDTEIEYVYDGVNITTIYGGNSDIYVYSIPETYDESKYSDKIYLKVNEDYLKTSVYGFSMEEDNPVFSKKFTLPYIDKSEEDNITPNWYVNDTDTGIPAKAKNAMNLNLVILYSYNNGSGIKYKVLSGLRNEDIRTEEGNIKYIYLRSSDDKIFTIGVSVPTIISTEGNTDEELLNWNNIIESSTLMIITNINDSYTTTDDIENVTINIKNEISKNDLVQRYGEDGLIVTLWTYNKDIQSYEVITIDQDLDGNPIALDFGRLGNFSSLIDYKASQINQKHPDNYKYRHLVFEQVLKQEKQGNNTTEYVHPILQNIEGPKYSQGDYINRFNFTLRYLSGSSINWENNIVDSNITSISVNNSSPYLTLGGNVTQSLYQYQQSGGATFNYMEFIPNYNIPIFDLSEVLIKDNNTLNRQNILSFDSRKNIYYSYIGTSFVETEKNILHIGTGNKNINLGNKTLSNAGTSNGFKEHNALSIDFKYTYLNGNVKVKDDLNIDGNLYTNQNNWKVKKVGNVTTYTMTIVPKFKYNSTTPITTINLSSDDLSSQINNIGSDYLYTAIRLSLNIGKNIYYYKYPDLLCIDQLLKYLGLNKETFSDANGTRIYSSTNDIISSGSTKKYIVTSTSPKQNDMTMYSSTNEGVTTSNNDSSFSVSSIYIANALDIIRIIDNNVESLIINEHKSNVLNTIWKLPLNI